MKVMKATVKINNSISKVIEFENKEESLWKQVALSMFEENFPIPATIEIVGEDGEFSKVSCAISEKKNSKEDKVEIKLEEDSFYLNKSHYEPVYLRKIDSKSDIRSRYDMRPNNMGKLSINIGAISGEIGRKGLDRLEDGIINKPFPSQLYWLRYYEKISSGYKDYTESLSADPEESKIDRFFREPDEAQLNDDAVQELYQILNGSVKENLTKSGISLDFYSDEAPYTRRQVTSARKLYLKMCEISFASQMNELLEDFIAIAAPKYQKGTKVQDFMVKIVPDTEEQNQLIIDKLEWVNSIVSSMEAVVSMKRDKKETYLSPFGDVKMSKLTDEEMEQFLKDEEPKINKRQIKDIVSIFDVKPTKKIKDYEKYLDETFGKKESLLFHGSPTCNWISIIKNGLSLNPNAEICGKAFGNGIYFAPDSDKSAGYMSNRGSRWRDGGDKYTLMGIYRVATGNPYHGTSIIGGSTQGTLDLLEMFQKESYDSFWYKANSGQFVRDEVIVYNESACVLDKLILMKVN